MSKNRMSQDFNEKSVMLLEARSWHSKLQAQLCWKLQGCHTGHLIPINGSILTQSKVKSASPGLWTTLNTDFGKILPVKSQNLLQQAPFLEDSLNTTQAPRWTARAKGSESFIWTAQSLTSCSVKMRNSHDCHTTQDACDFWNTSNPATGNSAASLLHLSHHEA